MIVLVCGGRNYGKLPPQYLRHGPEWELKEKEYLHIQKTLDQFAIDHSKLYNPNDNWLPLDIEIVSGGATGVDSAAIDWAVVNWCKFREYKADWKTYGRAAGAIRNLQMLDEEAVDYVIAFPGGKGTRHMINAAKEREGIMVIEIDCLN